MEFDVTLYRTKETPGTVVYTEHEDTPKDEKMIPSLYIRKTAMLDIFGDEEDWPETIIVTVESAD